MLAYHVLLTNRDDVNFETVIYGTACTEFRERKWISSEEISAYHHYSIYCSINWQTIFECFSVSEDYFLDSISLQRMNV